MKEKICSTCFLSKSIDDFYRKPRYNQYPDSLAGRSHTCKACSLDARRKHYAANKQLCAESDRNSRYKRVYGISLNEYNDMLKQQNFSCLGCKTKQEQLKRRLVVDHDHKTGKVRGLLCIPCNLTLGYVSDKPEILKNLITYLNIFSESAEFKTDVVAKSY